MTNFTPEQLIAFHYNDLSASEELQTSEALASSWPLQEKYRVIKEAAERLEKGTIAPPQHAVQKVLDYGKSLLNLSVLEN